MDQNPPSAFIKGHPTQCLLSFNQKCCSLQF